MSDYCPNCMEPLVGNLPCSRCGEDEHELRHLAHHLPAGTKLANGRYLLGRVLGQGGFGITYIARDLTLNVRVAVKEYYPTLYASRVSESARSIVALDSDAQLRLETGRRRFLEEARVLARYHDSPGIVDVRDFFEENGTAYIVMDYLEGETLKDVVRRQAIPADDMFALVRPIMDALELIHADQVIHRDISPDNIMLRSNGTLCLMDFGAAFGLDYGDRRTMSMVLKAGYAPEEQYRAKGELGPWTDIYALCATMYRAITGVAPDESLQRLLGDEMAWPSEMGVRITPAQELVLKKGMAPRHADRFQSIAEMREELARAETRGPHVGMAETDAEVAAAEVDVAAAAASPAGLVESLQATSSAKSAGDAGSAKSAADAGPAKPVVGAGPTQERASIPQAPPAKERPKRGRKTALGILAAACVLCALLAYYLLAPAFTVSFDTAGGGAVEPTSLNRIEVLAEPAPPSREGYEFAGWYLDDALSEKAEFPLKPSSDITLHAAWKKTQASYRVEYVDAVNEKALADPKVVKGATVGEKVTVEAADIEGYAVDGKGRAKLTVSADDSANTVAFKYHKLVGYEVRYVDEASGSEVSPSKTEGGIVEGTEVTEAAPEVSGYVLKSDKEQSITLGRNAKKNVIVFNYDPAPVEEAVSQPYYGGYYGGSPSGSGGNRSSGGSNNSSNDVQWAN